VGGVGGENREERTSCPGVPLCLMNGRLVESCKLGPETTVDPSLKS
jgi:hypothetical protein